MKDPLNLYGEFINRWYINHLKKMGIRNLGSKAKDATITDSEGNVFIDCTSGYGIANLGHNNDKLIEALIDQLHNKEVNSKPFINEIQVKFAELLDKTIKGELKCSFLLNSGSEAIETALKLVRLYKGDKKIIYIEDSFHGHTLGALSTSGVAEFKKSFEPLMPGFSQVPFGNFDAINNLDLDDVGAIIIEPIQHDAGVRITPIDYLQKVRKLCDEKNIILIFDEVITGFGKTGHMFAYEIFDVTPDILVFGKSLGGGLIPIGGVIAKKSLWQRFGLSFPMSATSYGGNTLACRVAFETINIILQNNLLEGAQRKGEIISDALNRLGHKHPEIIESVNGVGLLYALKMVNKNIAFEIVQKMIENKIIIYQSFGNSSILMFEPPLVITDDQISYVIDVFSKILESIDTGKVTRTV